jgi:uncharacterized protein YlxP (DUF503 family)
MIVGICTIELHLPGNRSMKGKRQVLQSVKDRLRHRFNVSIAEVDYQDLWQRALIGISTVGSDRGQVDRTLQHLVSAVEGMGLAELVDAQVEIL